MGTQEIKVVYQGKTTSLKVANPNQTLLEVLREDMQCTAVKEGCGEGDCGACTVTLGQLQSDGSIQYQAINSCIRLASSVDGMALWTADSIAPDTKTLHPVQQAMVDNHASQCGFCTPGFVMSLFAMYQNRCAQQDTSTITRDDAEHALSGNLCRCTGYRAIVDAALALNDAPNIGIDEKALAAQLAAIQKPQSLSDFLQTKAANPQAQVVAGCTDVGLWITKMHKRFDAVLDVTRVAELKEITSDAHAMHIGAAASLQDVFDQMKRKRPHLSSFAHRFAGLPVRNSGTLGGNVANGSPIGDSMPLLISLGASVTLQQWEGGKALSRDVALENLYTGYRQNIIAANEIITHIHVPHPAAEGFERVYKISKRFEDDISAVCLAINLRLENGMVAQASIGAGGVAATPVRAVQTESAITGQPWNEATVKLAQTALQAEFQPISDMRASKDYRSSLLSSLWQRFWLESQGETVTSLADSTNLEALA